MELKSRDRLIFATAIFCAFAILFLGGWWMSLVLKLGSTLKNLSAQGQGDYQKLSNMITWEGSTFIVLILIFITTILWLFLQDRRKNKATHVFFASLTHELKTPLTSVIMQSEFIKELIEEDQLNEKQLEQIKKLTSRLIEDGRNLEVQFDKALSLSRIQRGATLNLQPIDMISFLNRQQNKYKNLEIKIDSENDELIVLSDEHALETIFRNLFDNSSKHRSKNQPILLKLLPQNTLLEVHYNDQGEDFTGDISKLGSLFYKYDSSKGTGIGLYLIRKLLESMGGAFSINASPNLTFRLSIPLSRGQN